MTNDKNIDGTNESSGLNKPQKVLIILVIFALIVYGATYFLIIDYGKREVKSLEMQIAALNTKKNTMDTQYSELSSIKDQLVYELAATQERSKMIEILQNITAQINAEKALQNVSIPTTASNNTTPATIVINKPTTSTSSTSSGTTKRTTTTTTKKVVTRAS